MGKAGHMVRDCWSKGGGKEGQGPKKFSSRSKSSALKVVEVDDVFETAYVITESSIFHTSDSIQWLADTGATAHISPFRHIFSSYEEALPGSVVRGGGNTVVKVAGRGTVRLKFKLGKDNYIRHTLSNVLHVPLANACLLSISKFTESNGTAQFRKGQVNLLQADGKLLGVGKGEN